MRAVTLAIVFLATPVWAQESVLLNVNQTHTLSWNWESAGSPVRSFVFRCGQYVKEVVDADARSVRFGSLIEEPGRYTGCTLAARNEAGLSAPVAFPSFDYRYSYQALGRFLLELAAVVCAASGVLAVAGRAALGWIPRRKHPSVPLALPEPVIVLQKERDHAYRHH